MASLFFDQRVDVVCGIPRIYRGLADQPIKVIGERAHARGLSKRQIELPDIDHGQIGPEDKLTPMSYGELMPLLCNATADGRHANRRVEVWLRMKDSAEGVATAQPVSAIKG
ncbi:MAG TPA: hypothetical protein VMY41_11185 [Thermohalobaculum sp.]|nr:hypothetical protein [Thermohalobaculum sp.]